MIGPAHQFVVALQMACAVRYLLFCSACGHQSSRGFSWSNASRCISLGQCEELATSCAVARSLVVRRRVFVLSICWRFW